MAKVSDSAQIQDLAVGSVDVKENNVMPNPTQVAPAVNGLEFQSKERSQSL